MSLLLGKCLSCLCVHAKWKNEVGQSCCSWKRGFTHPQYVWIESYAEQRSRISQDMKMTLINRLFRSHYRYSLKISNEQLINQSRIKQFYNVIAFKNIWFGLHSVQRQNSKVRLDCMFFLVSFIMAYKHWQLEEGRLGFQSENKKRFGGLIDSMKPT